MKTLLKNAYDSIFVWNNKAKSYNKTCDVWVEAPASATNGVKIPMLNSLFMADYIEPLVKYGTCVCQTKDATSPALFTFDNGLKAIVMPTQ